MTKRELITEEHIVDILNKGLSKIEIDITREEVENMNFDYIFSYINTMNDIIKKNNKIDVEFTLMFYGYENDNRKMYEITEIKLYLMYVIVKKPELFVYLDKISKEAIITLTSYNGDIGKVSVKLLCDFMLQISELVDEIDFIPKTFKNKMHNQMLSLLNEMMC